MIKPHIEIGETKIRFTPSGIWMHKVWQNEKTYVCSGIKRRPDSEYEYRFTAIGDASIRLPDEDSYNDVFIKESELTNERTDKTCEAGEFLILGGWVRFTND